MPSEHGHIVHCNQAHYGPVFGGGAENRANDIQSVVGTGRGGCGKDVDINSGDGMDGPVLRSAAKHRSIMGLVTMSYVTVF